MLEERNSDYEEVTLMDYLKVIWKWKWFIIVGVLICTLTVGIISRSLPRIYEVSTVIRLGETGNRFVEDPSELTGEIKSGSLRREFGRKFFLEEEEIHASRFLQVESEIVETPNRLAAVIEITRETDKPDRGIKILGFVNETIVKAHQSKIEQTRKNLLGKIAINEDRIEIEKRRKEFLEEEMGEIRIEVETLKRVRTKLLRRELAPIDVPGMVVYFNDFQKRLELYYNTKNAIIETIPLLIANYQDEILTLEEKLNKIRETEVIDPPTSSYYPIRPRTKQNILISGTVSLLVLVLFSFLLDHIGRYRKGRKSKEIEAR